MNYFFSGYTFLYYVLFFILNVQLWQIEGNEINARNADSYETSFTDDSYGAAVGQPITGTVENSNIPNNGFPTDGDSYGTAIGQPINSVSNSVDDSYGAAIGQPVGTNAVANEFLPSEQYIDHSG